MISFTAPVWRTVNKKQCDRTFISLLFGDLVSISLYLSGLRLPPKEACKVLIMH